MDEAASLSEDLQSGEPADSLMIETVLTITSSLEINHKKAPSEKLEWGDFYKLS